MPSNTTDRNQNARQTAQEAAQAVRGLTNRSTDYHRLPVALRAIVDVHNLLDIANDQMAPVRRGDGMRPEDAPSGRMARELADLVEHTLWEIRRHGVIEGALAWLASHPEGWDDEPEHNWETEAAEIRSEYRHEDDARYQISDAEAEYRASVEAEPAEPNCPSCGSAATVLISPLTAGPNGWARRCKTCGNRWNLADDEGESVRTRDCHGCKRQFQPGDLCEQWAHTFSSAAPVRSLCADCSWPAAPAKRLKDGGYALRIGYTVPGNVTYAGDQGDDPLLHGYPREWFTGDRS